MRSTKTRFAIRKARVRNRINASAERLRLSVFKSGKYVYAQVIDDVKGVTVASASSLEKEIRVVGKSNCNKASATKVGELIASRAEKAGVSKVVFDKGGYKYHGVIQSLADAARKKLQF